MYLNFYQMKIGLKAQTPTNESTEQEIFLQILGFFFAVQLVKSCRSSSILIFSCSYLSALYRIAMSSA
jgi:hypothetical protein